MKGLVAGEKQVLELGDFNGNTYATNDLSEELLKIARTVAHAASGATRHQPNLKRSHSDLKLPS